jgi:hypothetical protein
VCVVSHPVPQHPGVEHSHPSVSGALLALQSERPELHWYVHVEPVQLAAPVFVLHALLHPPHVAVDESDDSQPFVLGAVVTQSAYPPAQPVYWQLPPLQLAPLLVLVSHARPHAPQFVAVVTCVSQPLVSGGVVLQSAYPCPQLVYLQVAPLLPIWQLAPLLCVVSHDVPHALHVADATFVSQPSVSGLFVSQSAYPELHPV